MDSTKFSLVAHRDHLFYGPINPNKLDRIISHISLAPNDRVIDIGAGSCEILVRILEKHQASGIGVELREESRAEAFKRTNGRVQQDKFTFVLADASQFLEEYSGPMFDLAVCTGSTHALGGYKPTLETLRRHVKHGGYILIGEGFWKQSPSPEYLKALGDADESELMTHAENIIFAGSLGLQCLWSSTASEDDWDEYEWLYSMSIENYVQENPDDPDASSMLSKIRSWRHAYVKWGRYTLGFGLYLFRNQ